MKTLEEWREIQKRSIRWPRDLKVAYVMLEAMKDSKQSINRDAVVTLKQRIREITKGIVDEFDSKERILVEDCDYYVSKIALKAKSREEAEEEFRREHYIEPYHSWYDCTGKPFTRSHKVVKQRGKWFAVHHVSFDM